MNCILDILNFGILSSFRPLLRVHLRTTFRWLNILLWIEILFAFEVDANCRLLLGCLIILFALGYKRTISVPLSAIRFQVVPRFLQTLYYVSLMNLGIGLYLSSPSFIK